MAIPLADFGPARVGGPGSVTHTGPNAEDGGQTLDEQGPFTAISTFTGQTFDIADPDTWCYDHEAQINDIANSLACLTRYNGHTKFYSVAEHSLRVSEWLREQGHDEMTQLLGLWHDATEAYFGDIPRPQKKLLCWSLKVADAGDGHPAVKIVPFEEYETTLLTYLLMHFGIINFTHGECYRNAWAAVKEADYAVYVVERSERPYPAMQGKRAMTPDLAETHWQLRNKRLMDTLFND